MINKLTTFFHRQPEDNQVNAVRKPETVFKPFILNNIWNGSALLKNERLSFLHQGIKRTQLQHTRFREKQVDLPVGNSEAKTRHENYEVYPPFPTKPTPLSQAHVNYISDERSIIDADKLKNFLDSHGIDSSLATVANINELIQSSNLQPRVKRSFLDKIKHPLRKSNTPQFKNLSPEARKLYHQMNFALLKEHLKDIEKLGNEESLYNPLGGFGLDYFEVEVADTLARGLAFIDKDLIEGQEIEIPVRVDGKFELKTFKIERFNLSDTANADGAPVDHSRGHPVFFLLPKDNTEKKVPPMLVARGTLLADINDDDGARISAVADGRKDMSLKWIAGNQVLANKMRDVAAEHGPIDICGHSLGGNIASILPIAFPAYVNRSTPISAAHVSKGIYSTWSQINPLDRPFVTQIPVEGDLVPGGGRRMVGPAVAARPHQECDNPVEQHLVGFNNKPVSYFAVDKVAEQNKPLRKLNTAGVVAAGRMLQIKGKTVKYLNKLPYVRISEDPSRKKALASLRTSSEAVTDSLINVDEHGNFAIGDLDRAKPRQILELIENNLFRAQIADKNFVESLSPQTAAKVLIALERATTPALAQTFKEQLSIPQRQYIYLLNASENDFKVAATEDPKDRYSFPSLRHDPESIFAGV